MERADDPLAPRSPGIDADPFQLRHSGTPRISISTARALAAAIMLGVTAESDAFISNLFLPREGIRPATHKVRIEHDVAFTTSDGVQLVADVYRPVTENRVPTILVRIPFTNTFGNRLRANAAAKFWASRGYTVVIQGSRGRYKSGGAYYPLRDERRDGIETLAWLSAQPWFDGRLGMWGGSTFGYTQWVIADQVKPGPTALMIQIASTDFHRMFYPGGAFSLESALFWAARSRGTRDRDPSFDDLARGFAGFPLVEADDRAVEDIPFFNDWVLHSTRDKYWHEIDGDNRPQTLKAPVFLTAGWYDPFLPGQIDDFSRVRREADRYVAAHSRLVIGPWTHADTIKLPNGRVPGNYRKAALSPTIEWFDRHLLGRPTPPDEKAVRIYVMGADVWRDESEWPLARTQYTHYYLRSGGRANTAYGDGRLTLAPPATHERADRYVYDPRRPVPTFGGPMLGPRAGMYPQEQVEARSDVLVYTTAALEHDLEVTGPIRAVLHVSTDAPNTDFTVKLVDVHPNGEAYNVSDGILRRTYPGPDGRDGQPMEIAVDLWPTSMLFRRGHRVRVQISSSNYPRFDRNPNTARDIATETEPRTAEQTIFHSFDSPSRLILPVIPR